MATKLRYGPSTACGGHGPTTACPATLCQGGLPQNLWAEWRIGSPSSDPQRARVLAAVKARRSAPAARGDGLDAGSAHAGPGSCGSPERGVGELRPVRGAPG